MIKTWTDKFNTCNESKKKLLDKNMFGGHKGQMLYVSNTQEIDKEIRKLTKGQEKTMKEIREGIAKNNNCDITCPVSSGIYFRISAEKAYEDEQEGNLNITPFWRVIKPSDNLSKKLACGVSYIVRKRKEEGLSLL